MWKKLLISLAILLGLLLAYAATRPAEYHVSRSTMMTATPETVHAIVNDFHQFPHWSPWQKLDPAMQARFEGSERGVGAVYHWSGNRDVGTGRMEITESSPKRVVMTLDFIEPFAAHTITTFDITPVASGSHVQWTMRGRHDYLGKLMSVFMDMDAMLGKNFDEGLANMKQLAEQPR